MRISLIAAVGDDGAIGREGNLPWGRLPADLRWFREKTMGHHVIMGRRTWESFPGGLPGRSVIVLSRGTPELPEGIRQAASLAEALAAAREAGEEEAFVAGGAAVYREALPLAGRLYLTRVRSTFEADTFFPEYDEGDWRLTWEERREPDAEHPHPLDFQVLDRRGERGA